MIAQPEMPECPPPKVAAAAAAASCTRASSPPRPNSSRATATTRPPSRGSPRPPTSRPRPSSTISPARRTCCAKWARTSSRASAASSTNSSTRPVSSIERLHGFADRSGELVRRAPDLTRRVLIAVLRSSRPGESGAELRSMQADFARLLEHGRERRVPAGLDVDLAAEILVSVVIGAMTHWINDPAYPLETQAARLAVAAGRPPARRPDRRRRAAPREPRDHEEHRNRPRLAAEDRERRSARPEEEDMKTELCKRLGIEFPIFAFSHCRDVVAAVSNAGGFGVLGAVGFSAEQLEVELEWIDEHVGGGLRRRHRDPRQVRRHGRDGRREAAGDAGRADSRRAPRVREEAARRPRRARAARRREAARAARLDRRPPRACRSRSR